VLGVTNYFFSVSLKKNGALLVCATMHEIALSAPPGQVSKMIDYSSSSVMSHLQMILRIHSVTHSRKQMARVEVLSSVSGRQTDSSYVRY